MAIKVIHVEGGLGNQMACYAVYVAAKESNPNDAFYIDTYIYDVKEAHDTISMWNGYELNKVFGVEIKDIRSLFTNEQIQEQIDELKKTEFWKHNWNYADAFLSVMKKYGIELQNAYSNTGDASVQSNVMIQQVKKLMRKYGAGAAKSGIGYRFKALMHKLNNRMSSDCGKYICEKRSGNVFYDITLDFMKSPYLHDLIGKQVREALQFVEPLDEINQKYIDRMRGCSSVSIHVRRTDYLKFNEDCYKYGYFTKCVKYIKQKVTDPVFYVFSDDLQWCRNHTHELGLLDTDKVVFVTANSGANSYRDMQLMSNCKHNIATKSSFGWWASFLNANPDKITCCQISQYVCTNQF